MEQGYSGSMRLVGQCRISVIVRNLASFMDDIEYRGKQEEANKGQNMKEKYIFCSLT